MDRFTHLVVLLHPGHRTVTYQDALLARGIQPPLALGRAWPFDEVQALL
jgi:hypothetical protein